MWTTFFCGGTEALVIEMAHEDVGRKHVSAASSGQRRGRRHVGTGNTILVVTCILFGLLAIFWDSIEAYMMSGAKSCPYLMGETDAKDAHRYVQFSNGYVLTGLRGSGSFVTEFVVDTKTGRFVDGSNVTGQSIHVDLDGALVTPGLVDAHVHFLSGGLALMGKAIDAGGIERLQELGDIIKNASLKTNQGDWIVVYNYKGELGSKAWLDTVTGDVPCVIFRFDFHQMLANSVVLEKASISKSTQEPPGGSIGTDADGNPNGVLCDNAMSIVTRLMPQPTSDDLLQALEEAQKYAFSKGCTYVHDMGRVSFVEGDFASFDDLQSVYIPAADSGLLSIRMQAFVSLKAWEGMAAMVDAIGNQRGTLMFGNVKDFYDGSLSSRTALMHHAYKDDENHQENRGIRAVEEWQQWLHMIKDADTAGLRIGIHAIGSRAVDDVLDVFENSTTHTGHRIEHAQHISGLTAIDRMSNNKVSVTPNPLHWVYDKEVIPTRLHEADAKYSFPLAKFADKEIQMGLASDWPVVDLSPWDTLEAAIDPQNPHALSFTDALWAITRGAVLIGDPHAEVGLIQDGMLSDFVIHTSDDRNKRKSQQSLYDPMDLFPSKMLPSSTVSKIKQVLGTRTGVKQTYISGSCVFGCS